MGRVARSTTHEACGWWDMRYRTWTGGHGMWDDGRGARSEG
jgi:hypothetical protein